MNMRILQVQGIKKIIVSARIDNRLLDTSLLYPSPRHCTPNARMHARTHSQCI